MQYYFWHSIHYKMKRLLEISLILLCSCFYRDPETIELAKHHNADTPLSSLLHSYICSYLEYPHSTEDLYDYLSQCQAYWGDDCFNNSNSKDHDTKILKRELKRNRISILSFSDSCFLFSRKFKTGAIAYGSPAEWQMSRNCSGYQDHWWDYSPAFIDSNGKVILQMQDFALAGEFAESIKSLIRTHKDRHALLTHRFENYVYLKVLWVYSRNNGLEMLSQPEQSPLFKVDMSGSLQTVFLDIKHDCTLFSKQLEQIANYYLTNYKKVAEIRFITAIYDDEELSLTSGPEF